MQGHENTPLMPKSALVYFLDEKASTVPYHKVSSIRSCLENIVETIFVHIIDPDKKSDWRRSSLSGQLELLACFFPADINERIRAIRLLGNKGAHQDKHKQLSDDAISVSLSDLSRICEWTILSYFKKNGFTSHPWIPTVFSTLPPVYRVRILEELMDFDSVDNVEVRAYLDDVQDHQYRVLTGQISPENHEPTEQENKFVGFLLTIDKLAMAYLKNKELNKALDFLEDVFQKGFINETFRSQMLEKLQMLEQNFDELPIAASLDQTRRALEKILPVVREDEQSLFITLFSAIVLEKPDDTLDSKGADEALLKPSPLI
ncbi:hypothetical protein [Pseudomonas sp. 7-41]|uniref:hypothetical protein n=1 Tax=Pseudomonas sp. 7-41 TaxID=2898483 RepID=UPI001E59525F|nr:hypothetical protein [Pseudomonas sp. 7-41]UHG95138.1 hypothetical protein LQ249_15575 [Pseudomonas sp. 7-41]